MTADYSKGVAYVAGDYVSVDEAKIPLLDWGFLRSDANQDTISVWKGLFFRLDDHLARFKRNIEQLRMVGPLSEDERRSVLFECVRRTGFRDAYLQMIMTRGRPPIGVRDPRRCINQFYVFCVPYMWVATPEQQARGLNLIVSDIQRVPPASVSPTVKHYHWLDFEMGLFEAYDRGDDTVVLTDGSANVTEGPGFNLFVVRDGALATPAEGVLDGMTRRTVFDLCGETNLRCDARSVSVAETKEADEVFLTTTAGGIIPVTRVDGVAIGDGTPGPVTWRLRDLYWRKREAGWHGTPAEYDGDA